MTLEFSSDRGDCRQIEALLPPFVDGEASDRDRDRVASHLERCAVCRQTAEAQGAVRAAAARPPRGLARRRAAWTGGRGAGRGAARRRPHRRSAEAAGSRRWRRPPRSCWRSPPASSWGTGRSSVLLAAQLTLDHIKCFIVDGDDHADHYSADVAEARMQEQFGWSVAIPTPAARPDVHLVSVRRCLYGEGMVAHVLYRVAGPAGVAVRDARSRRQPTDISAFGRHAAGADARRRHLRAGGPGRLTGVAAAVGLEAE